jgi:hypothetical protein
MKNLNEILQNGGLSSHISSVTGELIGGVSKNDSLGIIAYKKGFLVRKELTSYKATLPGVKGRVSHEEINAPSEDKIGAMILEYYKVNNLI